MKIHFLGTGEAADSQRRNTSILIETDGHHHLLDCGFTSAQAYLSRTDSDLLETIWISHFHGDHFFGIPQLILHFYLQEREMPLLFLAGSANLHETIEAVMELAYPGLTAKLSFQLRYHQVEQDSAMTCNGLSWQCAPTDHSQEAYGLRLDTRSQAIYYSGDGRPTSRCTGLMQGCDLVIHEAYSLKRGHSSHFSLEECLALSRNSTIGKLALVHLHQATREAVRSAKDQLPDHDSTRILIPEDGDELQL